MFFRKNDDFKPDPEDKFHLGNVDLCISANAAGHHAVDVCEKTGKDNQVSRECFEATLKYMDVAEKCEEYKRRNWVSGV